MANRYFRNSGSTSWGIATNWSTTNGGPGDGTVPTASDAVFLTSLSGNCNINITSFANSFNCTGYTGTLSGASTITISGDVTLSPTMTITATGTMINNSTNGHNLTSSGKTWTGTLQISGGLTKTYTLVDDWTVQNFTTSSSNVTLVGGNVNVLGNFNSGGSTTPTSTSTIYLKGTGTYSGAGGNGVAIVIDTTGTITVTGTNIITKSITYIKGTLNSASANLTLYTSTGSVQTADLRDSTWNTINIGTTSAAVNLTFLSGFTCSNLLYNTTSTSTVFVYFTPGAINRVTNSFIATLTDGNFPLNKMFRSTVPGTRATLTLDVGATCSIAYICFTDIDASGGRTINTLQAVVNNCINVNPYSDPIQTTPKSFVT